jgi:hypothetical protein
MEKEIMMQIENRQIINVGMNKKWLRYKLKVTCYCGSTCILYNYFIHCDSQKHNRYLQDNCINSIYTIKSIF